MFRSFITLFLSCSLLSLFAQTPDAKRVLSQIQRADKTSLYQPQEKVYLHLDNTGYFQGETIYLKAYLMRTDTERLSDLSHVLYVDLLTPNGNVVERRKLKVTNGLAAGDIRLDNILLTGYYEIRAYTRYMTNWGTEACFSRVIPIFKRPNEPGQYSHPKIDQFSYTQRLMDMRGDALANDSINATLKQNEKNRQLKVRFYPEGGNLVSGLESRVAYTVIDGDSEVVRDIIKVRPMDLTPLTVNVDQDYHLVSAEGKKGNYEMPAALSQGVVLNLDVTDEQSVKVSLAASGSLKQKVMGYALMHNGIIQQSDTLVVADGNTLSFLRASLKEGVNQLTVFLPNGQILADRLFWIRPQSSILDTITAVTTTPVIKPCKRVSFDIQAAPHSSLSFSAMDAASMTGGTAGNARTELLLSSEVRGYIAHPEYYFESDDLAHRQAADLLLMIQGWRRYDWQLFNGNKARLHNEPIEDRLALFGKILPRRSRQKVENTLVKATMYNREGQVLEGEFTTEADGSYLFDMPDIDNDWTLLMTSQQEEKNKNFIISIDRQFEPETRYIEPAETQTLPVAMPCLKWEEPAEIDPTDAPVIHIGEYLLDEVVVKKRATNWTKGWSDETEAKASSMLFFDCDAFTEKLVDRGEEIPGFDEWLVSISDAFEGSDFMTDPASISFEGLEVIEDAEATDVETMQFYHDGLSYRGRPILWIIDNMFWGVSNYHGSTVVNVLYQEKFLANMEFPTFLDDVRSCYISEDVEASHNHFESPEVDAIQPVVMYVYTHRTVKTKVKGLRRTHYQGFNVPHVFEMDDYSVLPPMDDFRRTLYWTPSLRTDAEGKAHVEFYNNSSCKEMYLSIEGVSYDGHIQVNR